jgi:hypothetical protein
MGFEDLKQLLASLNGLQVTLGKTKTDSPVAQLAAQRCQLALRSAKNFQQIDNWLWSI